MLPLATLDGELALVGCGISNLCVCNSLLVEICAEVLVVCLGNLNHDTGILGEESLHDVTVAADVVEVDVHTTFDIGKCHLKECGDKTTGTDVVSAVYPTAVDHLVDSIEGIGKILRVLDCRNIVAHLAKTLCESTTAEALLVEREVDMIEGGTLVVDHYRTDNLADIRNLTAT